MVAARLRGLNFAYFSLFALFLSFLPVYASHIGISGTHIGLVLGTGSVVTIVCQPFWGMVSDRRRTIKRVLLALLLASVVAGTLLFRADALWSLALLVIAMNMFFMPTDALMESLNYQTSQRQGISFGSIRMFGAMGYLATSLTAGWLMQSWGMDSLSWIFLGFGAATLLLALGAADVPASSKPAAFRQLWRFVSEPRTLAFLLLVLAVAIPHKMNDMYIGLYMDELGGNVRWTGMAWFVMTLTETAMFAVSSRIVKPGREGFVMAVAAGLYMLRFLLCSFVGDPLQLVGLQVFQGFTFVLFYVSSMQYLYSIVPEQWKSTGQTVLTLLFFGVSGIVGSSLGGWLFDLWGGAALYRIMAAASAVAFVYAIFLVRSRR
ncbi:putative transporter YwbF [Cohnella xylanilytica]|uniref:MFS transporter n=1 Tax=Cohnella xylanilytica TaxID=557555 RepID=UPI001B14C869|nr:MFS transporter [Cohnella xylanilytica]GIO10471.1 putative transporter YwbF [Cohnella xylanilytica]